MSALQINPRNNGVKIEEGGRESFLKEESGVYKCFSLCTKLLLKEVCMLLNTMVNEKEKQLSSHPLPSCFPALKKYMYL